MKSRLLFLIVLLLTGGHSAAAETLEELLLAEPLAKLAADARQSGDAARGAALVHSRAIACTTCHSIGDRTGSLGPDFTKLERRTTDEAIVESILLPSKVIAPGYATTTVETNDGRIVSGLHVAEDAERLVLRTGAAGDTTTTISRKDIAERSQATVSIMPSGQINQLAGRGQFLDLVRYLIELRDGGAQRARELQPPPTASEKVPDPPQAWQPVVQRGELKLGDGGRFPRSVAIGFDGGSVLFDADTLGVAAVWTGGFVTSRRQDYMGLWWDQADTSVETFAPAPHPMAFRLDGKSDWQDFEPPTTSDPNTGTRFDGYQVGTAAVRLRYRVLVGGRRIGVSEDVRVERRHDWLGCARDFRFTGLPAGARVAVALPPAAVTQLDDAGTPRAAANPAAAFLRLTSGTTTYIVHAQRATLSDTESKRVVSSAAGDAGTLKFRVDLWKYCGHNPEPRAEEIAALGKTPPVLDIDDFDRPARPPSGPPPAVTGPGGDGTGGGRKPLQTGRDAAPGYVVEGIPAPFGGAKSDIAFSDDGMMYVLAMTTGQVWRTPVPPPGRPEQVAWQRFASGLFHPIGLQIVDGRVYVAQKPEISELIDRDGDGRADHYRTVATGWGLSTAYHEYCFGLAADADRNLWFALNTGGLGGPYSNPGRFRGSIFRIDRGSEKVDAVATGCRVPNGITRGPDGTMFFTDNQGNWIPSCKLAPIVAGRFYGHPETAADVLPKQTSPDGRSAVWIPHSLQKSTSGPAWDDTKGRFGPFADQMFVGDARYGDGPHVIRIALEKVNGEYQGACFRFIDQQVIGSERMTFGPDQHLYYATLGGLGRIRHTGQTPAAVHSLHVRPGGVGFAVNLTKPVAADATPTADQFKVRCYHYEYSSRYGCPEQDVRNIAVEQVDVSEDRRRILLAFPVETHPLGMVYAFDFPGLKFDGGEALGQTEAWYTVQQIPERLPARP